MIRVVTVVPEGEPLVTCHIWPLSRWHWYWYHLLLRYHTEQQVEYQLFQGFPLQRSSHKLKIQPPSLNQDHRLELPTLKNIEYCNFYLISRITLRWIAWLCLLWLLIIIMNLLQNSYILQGSFVLWSPLRNPPLGFKINIIMWMPFWTITLRQVI